MSFTKFGEILRKLRIQNNEVMGDSAKLLNVSVPFISAVENGKKNVPLEWIDILSEYYHLSALRKEELRKAAEDSRTAVKIKLENSQTVKRELAIQFQRSFDDIDFETAEELLRILKKVYEE